MLSTMTVEAAVTRALDISFLDARKLTTLAKLNIGITGYPNAMQSEMLLKEVKRIFRKELPKEERRRMRRNNVNLVNAKNIDDVSSSSSTQSVSSASASASAGTISLCSSTSCSTRLGDANKKNWLRSSKAATMSIDDLSRANHSSSPLIPLRSDNKVWRPALHMSLSPIPTSSNRGNKSSSRSPMLGKTKERLLCIMTGTSNPQQAGDKNIPSRSAVIAA
jgi:hypothetical protein